MEEQRDSDIIQGIIERARVQSGHTKPFSRQFWEIRRELRMRRKLFLGSGISLRELVLENDSVNDRLVTELSNYLAEKSLIFWSQPDEDIKEFFFQFYQLAIYSLCSKPGPECVDDIIVVAECLVLELDAFVDYMKESLPEDMIGALVNFTEYYSESMFCAKFENAVLGAVSVFLGVLEPLIIPKQPIHMSKEAIERVRNKKISKSYFTP